MSAEDRVALILGRAVMRAEALQAELEVVRARLAELEADTDGGDDERAKEGR